MDQVRSQIAVASAQELIEVGKSQSAMSDSFYSTSTGSFTVLVLVVLQY